MRNPAAAQNISMQPTVNTHGWERTAFVIILISFALRLFFIGFQELIPEEAYYWQFARHLDFSYLDHPPMVAWLIAIGNTIFGFNEFGTRIGALFCSALAALYVWKLAKLFFDRDIALLSVMLFAILPYTFISGFLVTPDAPLVLFWAAALYYLARALGESSKAAWIGVGVCFGLGMISKYTIVLLGLATIIFMLVHRPSRRWFFSLWPYCAAVITLLLFSPVLYWNSKHDWVSFAFQTSQRIKAPSEFGLHVLLISLLCLITPTGTAAVWKSLRSCSNNSSAEEFRSLFLRIYLLTPILVFFVFSINHIPKINWTGPAFLVSLPFLAAMFRFKENESRLDLLIRKTWYPTVLALLIIYCGAFYYFVSAAGIGYTPRSQRFVGWTDLGLKIKNAADQMEKSTGQRPLIVGMDKHFLASEIGFYTPKADGTRPLAVSEVAGRSIFGRNALMWELWNRDNLTGKNLLLVARWPSDLEFPGIEHFVERLDPIQEVTTQTRGSMSGKYYFRQAFGYGTTTGGSNLVRQ